MNRHQPISIKMSVQRMVCTGCGAEANASCNCGVSYVPKAVRAREMKEANPARSNSSIARELDMDATAVRKALQKEGVSYDTPERVMGDDGKSYPVRYDDATASYPERSRVNSLISEIGKRTDAFLEHVEAWILETPNAPHEALGALAMAISNASDVLAETAAKLNRKV